MKQVLPLFTKCTVMPQVIAIANSIYWHGGRTAMQSTWSVSLYSLSCWIFWLYIFHISLRLSDMLPETFVVYDLKWVCTLCAHLYTNVTARLWTDIHFLLELTTVVWPDCKIAWLQRIRYDLFENARLEIPSELCFYKQSDQKALWVFFFPVKQNK